VVQDLLIQVVQFVQDHEHPLGDVLHDRGQGAFPADVLAAEGEPPAFQPAVAAHRRMRAALGHERRVHIGGIRRVQLHGSPA
jgi:hypothetical protein